MDSGQRPDIPGGSCVTMVIEEKTAVFLKKLKKRLKDDHSKLGCRGTLRGGRAKFTNTTLNRHTFITIILT